MKKARRHAGAKGRREWKWEFVFSFPLLLLCVLCVLCGLIRSARADVGDGKVVCLDYFYNHQIKNGKQFHYIWDDTAASGYSKFGEAWKHYGASLDKLQKAPTLDDLNKYSVYLIVNPNNVVKAADHKPNYIESDAIEAIVAWVHDGGVLGLFANDEKVGGCEYVHLDHLAQRFGITFNDDVRNLVPSARDRTPGTFDASLFPDEPLFKDVKMIFMKEICTLQVADPAKALLTAPKQVGQGTDIIMATAQYGKGFVFAVGDPWVYNEYIDVKSPGLPIENRQAAQNLAQWLLSEASTPVKP
jgi:unsaturated rhamnogalacturonyl hydrolase